MNITFADYLTKNGACVVQDGGEYKIVGFKSNPYLLFENWSEHAFCNLEHIKAHKVSQEVADWYEDNKQDLEFRLWQYIHDFDNHFGEPFYDFIDLNPHAIEILLSMKHGYITEGKIEKYALVNPLTKKRLVFDKKANIYYEESDKFLKKTDDEELKITFTLREIKAMNANLYERKLV